MYVNISGKLQTLGLLHYFLLLIVRLFHDWLWANIIMTSSVLWRHGIAIIRALLFLAYWRAVVKYLLGNISTVVVCLITVLATRSYCPVWDNSVTFEHFAKRGLTWWRQGDEVRRSEVDLTLTWRSWSWLLLSSFFSLLLFIVSSIMFSKYWILL